MKIDSLKRFAVLVLVCALFAIAVSGQRVTQSEREQALQYLAETRVGLVKAVTGLSDAQLKFKPAPGRWSIAETLEHITVTENFFLDRIAPQLEQSPAPAKDGDAKEVDRMILDKVPDRSTRYQAPAMLQPTGRWAPQAILDQFLASRDRTVSFLTSHSDLRQHAVDHPVLGKLDGYEWVLVTAAHSARHTKQILEVKADPHFPPSE